MRNLLIVFIGTLFFIGCSKSFKDVSPELWINIAMQEYDISPNDTAGLAIFGLGYLNGATDTVALLGNKNGYLWVQLIESTKSTPEKFKKITNFTIKSKFNDRREVDLGYGNRKVIELEYWSYPIFRSLKYFVSMINRDYFSIATEIDNVVLSWLICDKEILDSQIFYLKAIPGGYIGIGDDGLCAYNVKGNFVYKCAISNNDVFITFYECISISKSSIARQNAETGEIIWKSEFEKMGQVIDGHEPKIEQTIEITDNTAYCTFNITNYDGSTETRNFKVNIETGEVTKL